MGMSSREYYDHVQELKSHADPDPDRCPCGGGGWLLSSFDTWEHCPFAGHTGPHPEEDPRCGGCQACQDLLGYCLEEERDTTFDMHIYGPLQWSDIPF